MVYVHTRYRQVTYEVLNQALNSPSSQSNVTTHAPHVIQYAIINIDFRIVYVNIERFLYPLN